MSSYVSPYVVSNSNRKGQHQNEQRNTVIRPSLASEEMGRSMLSYLNSISKSPIDDDIKGRILKESEDKRKNERDINLVD
jgi:hypothetical protein